MKKSLLENFVSKFNSGEVSALLLAIDLLEARITPEEKQILEEKVRANSQIGF